MYTLIVNQDNTIITSIKERIVQRSKLYDKVHILIPTEHRGMDMSDFDVTMFYELPVSKEKYSLSLIRQSDIYKSNFFEYIIPADTWLTKEAGSINFYLTFSKVEMSDSQPVQYVGKATGGIIEIASCDDWGSALADGLLQTVDQRIIQMQMLAKQMDEQAQTLYDLYDNKADGLSYEDNMLQLTSNGKGIGNKVTFDGGSGDCDHNDDGTIKVINF